MKRANINLIVKREETDPRVLYYPFLAEEGSSENLRDPLLKWLNKERFDAEGFTIWIRSSFSHVGQPAEVEQLPYPVIYYDASGFRVPYSFLLDANHEEAIVWRWERRVFRGTLQELAQWLTSAPKAATTATTSTR